MYIANCKCKPRDSAPCFSYVLHREDELVPLDIARSLPRIVCIGGYVDG